VDERERRADRDGDLGYDGTSIEERAFAARQAYEKERKLYTDFARSVEDVLRRCLEAAGIRVHEISSREKDPDSFERKAAKRKIDNPDEPKYSDPLSQITDKAAVRIITYLLSNVDSVCEIIEQEFAVHEHPDNRRKDPERLGYASVHYLVSYDDKRNRLRDFAKYAGLVAEIQVRTILQHAWAEIEHDIQYKALVELPSEVRRGFTLLAGMIEVADQRFQEIADADRALRDEAVTRVNDGEYSDVEIRRDSVRAYLTDKLGPSGPDTDISYDWTVRVLLALGFKDLADVNQCVKNSKADRISRVVDGTQQQDHIARFESVLLASMGENYILAHPWAINEQLARGFISTELGRLAKLEAAGIQIGHYRPAGYPEVLARVRDLVAALQTRGGSGDAASW
jgi:ppGpp synthetase/RelA/SpoT-type nucleotidyltranferase